MKVTGKIMILMAKENIYMRIKFNNIMGNIHKDKNSKYTIKLLKLII